MKHVSLGELSLKLRINKSKLSYFFTIGLLEPVSQVGKMNIFDEEKTIKKIKKIDDLKKQGKKLKEIKILLNK